MKKKAVKKAARKNAPPAMTPIVSPAVRQLVPVSHIRAFEEVLQLIQSAKDRASQAMVAEYETMLPDKELLKAKLHEFYQLCAPPEEDNEQDKVLAAPAKPKRKKKGVRA